MSLEPILAAIRAAGEQQVAEIERRAGERAEALLADARNEAQKVRQDARARALAPAYRERARIIHRARLERLRTVGDAREAAIDAALAEVRLCLTQLRTDPCYPTILQRLTREALSELQGSLEDITRAYLEIDSRDKALMVRILRELDLSLCVHDGLDCWGGLVARSEDGCIVVINTLESRLDRAMPFLRRYLAALFEKGETIRLPTTMETPAYER